VLLGLNIPTWHPLGTLESPESPSLAHGGTFSLISAPAGPGEASGDAWGGFVHAKKFLPSFFETSFGPGGPLGVNARTKPNIFMMGRPPAPRGAEIEEKVPPRARDGLSGDSNVLRGCQVGILSHRST
jgi:hypothetical protein